MAIEIVNGFLKLTEFDVSKNFSYVKGSSIVAMRPYKTGTQVAFDTNCVMSVFWVTENIQEILPAIAESYRQARSR